MLKLATLFSGIGAIEQALKNMKIDYKIEFACDNGERELPIDKKEIEKKLKKLLRRYTKDKYEIYKNRRSPENQEQMGTR